MSDLEQIALNAIRWRAGDDNDGKAMAQGDRRWLLRYLDSRPGLDARQLHEVGQPHLDPLTAESCRRLGYGLCERIIGRLVAVK